MEHNLEIHVAQLCGPVEEYRKKVGLSYEDLEKVLIELAEMQKRNAFMEGLKNKEKTK